MVSDKPLFWPLLAPIRSLFLPIFMLNLDEKGTDSLPLIHLCLYCGLSMLPGRTLGFGPKNIAFRRNWRKNWGQMKPRESQWEWTEQRTTMHVVARSAYARLPVLVSTAVCRAASRNLLILRRFFWGTFHFYCFSFLESTLRDSFRVSWEAFSLLLFGLNWKIEDCFTLVHQLIQVCFSLLFSLIFVFRVLLVLPCLLHWMLEFVFWIWLLAKSLILGWD